MLDWQKIRDLAAQEAELHTISGKAFHVVGATDQTVTVEVSTGRRHGISRTHLEQAVVLVQQGQRIKGPKDFKDYVADDRPTYAWAILHHLDYV
jgi:hypothetical protein